MKGCSLFGVRVWKGGGALCVCVCVCHCLATKVFIG